MKKILFLDFDGVLHGEWDALFSKRELFEHYLQQMPQVDIVISSTWRELYSLERLKEHFHISLRDRIIGVTPILGTIVDPKKQTVR